MDSQTMYHKGQLIFYMSKFAKNSRGFDGLDLTLLYLRLVAGPENF
jgi:hypothetical protein